MIQAYIQLFMASRLVERLTQAACLAGLTDDRRYEAAVIRFQHFILAFSFHQCPLIEITLLAHSQYSMLFE